MKDEIREDAIMSGTIKGTITTGNVKGEKFELKIGNTYIDTEFRIGKEELHPRKIVITIDPDKYFTIIDVKM